MPAGRYESPEQNLARLVQRRRYAQAIEILRTRLARQRPDPRTRLRLADLLLAAGRGAEAVPVLLALSDELAASGELAKAVAALKRVERLEPQRADVKRQLQQLVEERHRLLQATAAAPPAGEAAPPATVADEPTPPPVAAAPTPETAGDDDPSDLPATNGDVAVRFRGLLGRLLGNPDEAAASGRSGWSRCRPPARGPRRRNHHRQPRRSRLWRSPRQQRPRRRRRNPRPRLPPPGPRSHLRPRRRRPRPSARAERRGGLRGLLGRLFGRASEPGGGGRSDDAAARAPHADARRRG